MPTFTMDANAEAQALISVQGRDAALAFAEAMAVNATHNNREASAVRSAFWTDVATLIRLETAGDEAGQ